ncbi:asparaginase [Alicyclobacillus dauci]|uniref:Asparaginase n=1 Tax=Alicyclobacillus dauci TaxID=1475485 RepID=A0ABY6Z949_9BACL|nr:asparaginase [Alicyclobacillus dauci]WAH38696.1 asparaginase [Alicyclobacillus dauci]
MDNSILNVYRGDVVENSHRGHIAVVNANGELLYSFGDPFRITHGRSALKPFQVLPVMETGTADHYGFTDADLALCASSHSGEEIHRSRATAMLWRVGIDESHLQCGVSPPIDTKSYEELIRSGQSVTAVCNECSGVHIGMLATATYMKEPLGTYTSETHPVQKRVKKAVADLTDYPENGIQLAIDGCGIPTYCMPLTNIAKGFARLSTPEIVQKEHQESVDRIVNAYLNRPEMVTGEELYSTRVMRVFGRRLLVKEGSQGVYGICDRDTGIGIAIKIEDGRLTELPPVVNEVLRQLKIGIDGEIQQLAKDTNPPLKNTLQQPVGRFKTEFVLEKHKR